MYEGPNLFQFRIVAEALGNQVFDRLDVMIGRALDLFHALRIRQAEVLG